MSNRTMRIYIKLQRLLARWGLKLPGKIMYIGGSDTLPPSATITGRPVAGSVRVFPVSTRAVRATRFPVALSPTRLSDGGGYSALIGT